MEPFLCPSTQREAHSTHTPPLSGDGALWLHLVPGKPGARPAGSEVRPSCVTPAWLTLLCHLQPLGLPVTSPRLSLCPRVPSRYWVSSGSSCCLGRLPPTSCSSQASPRGSRGPPTALPSFQVHALLSGLGPCPQQTTASPRMSFPLCTRPGRKTSLVLQTTVSRGSRVLLRFSATSLTLRYSCPYFWSSTPPGC